MKNNAIASKMYISIIATLSILNIGWGFIYDFNNDLIFRTFILITLAMVSYITKKRKACSDNMLGCTCDSIWQGQL